MGRPTYLGILEEGVEDLVEEDDRAEDEVHQSQDGDAETKTAETGLSG